VIVKAPGGKLVAICTAQIMIVIKKSAGPLATTRRSNNKSGFDRNLNRDSMVEIFSGDRRRVCHRHCVNEIASEAFRLMPNAFESIIDAVAI
jgi:hypothetical protein